MISEVALYSSFLITHSSLAANSSLSLELTVHLLFRICSIGVLSFYAFICLRFSTIFTF